MSAHHRDLTIHAEHLMAGPWDVQVRQTLDIYLPDGTGVCAADAYRYGKHDKQ
jgi:hypothetical protein